MGISACVVEKMEIYCTDYWKFGKKEALEMKNEVWRMKIEICERGEAWEMKNLVLGWIVVPARYFWNRSFSSFSSASYLWCLRYFSTCPKDCISSAD